MAEERNWTSHTTELKKIAFEFMLPDGESDNFPPSNPVVGRIDIEDKKLKTGSQIVVVTRKYWDYKVGFGGMPKGALKLIIYVRRVPKEFVGKIQDPTLLKEAVFAGYSNAGNPTISGASIETLNDIKWLKYNVKLADDGSSDTAVYTTNLDDEHYLLVQGYFIDNSLGNPGEWRDEAERNFHRMVNSFKINSQ